MADDKNTPLWSRADLLAMLETAMALAKARLGPLPSDPPIVPPSIPLRSVTPKREPPPRSAISFVRRSPRREDWSVQIGGRAIGSVWCTRDGYIVCVGEQVSAPTAEAAFAAARRMARKQLG